MVFRKRGARTYQTRVLHATLSTQRVVEADAAEVEALLARFAGRTGERYARPDVVRLLLAKRLRAGEVYDAYVAGTLDALVARAEAGDAAAAVVDLDPLVTAWAATGVSVRYVRQVRGLIPAGQRFPVSAFTTPRLARHFASLTLKVATKQTIRTAFSQFAKWLIEAGHLTGNPVRDTTIKRRAGEAARTPIAFLEEAETRRLVEALPLPYRALEAFMAGGALEWGAVVRLTRADVDTSDPDARLVRARGTKNPYRDRYVEITEEWAWNIIAAYVRDLAPAAPLFPALRDTKALAVHHATAKALGLRRTTLHQHRHAYAVLWIRRGVLGKRPDGRDAQWLKNQLGHAPQSTLIHTTYGLYINAWKLTTAQQERTQERTRSAIRSGTNSGTSARKRMK